MSTLGTLNQHSAGSIQCNRARKGNTSHIVKKEGKTYPCYIFHNCLHRKSQGICKNTIRISKYLEVGFLVHVADVCLPKTNCQTPFQSDWSILYFHQQCRKVLIAPHLCHYSPLTTVF